MLRSRPRSALFPYTTLFRSHWRCRIFCGAGPLSVSCASSTLTSSATSWWLYSGAKRWRRRRLTRTSPSSPYRVIRRVICARLSPVIFSIYRRSKPRAVRPNASQFCSPRHPLTQAQTSSFFSPTKCTASLAFKKTRISSRLIPGLLLTLIVNTQHGRSPLQAHLACETAPPSRLILHETRLPFDHLPQTPYTESKCRYRRNYSHDRHRQGRPQERPRPRIQGFWRSDYHPSETPGRGRRVHLRAAPHDRRAAR